MARTTRHAFPEISYTPASQLRSVLPGRVGAFPRDPMDRRLLAPVRENRIDAAPIDAQLGAATADEEPTLGQQILGVARHRAAAEQAVPEQRAADAEHRAERERRAREEEVCVCVCNFICCCEP